MNEDTDLQLFPTTFHTYIYMAASGVTSRSTVLHRYCSLSHATSSRLLLLVDKTQQSRQCFVSLHTLGMALHCGENTKAVHFH